LQRITGQTEIFEFASFSEDKLKETPWIPLWNTDHDGHTILNHLEQVSKGWRQQIHARKDSWATHLLNDHFSTYCEKRRKHFRSHIERLLTDFEADAKPKEKAATETENLIGQMNEALRNLELPLANANDSMK
jgi:hypothetical protein